MQYSVPPVVELSFLSCQMKKVKSITKPRFGIVLYLRSVNRYSNIINHGEKREHPCFIPKEVRFLILLDWTRPMASASPPSQQNVDTALCQLHVYSTERQEALSIYGQKLLLTLLINSGTDI